MSVETCVQADERLLSDTRMLSNAAVAGALQTRADASRHQGEFARIVEGVNATLDSITSPVDKGAAVLERLALRDLRARVQGEFQGDHARLRRAVDATADALHSAVSQGEGGGRTSVRGRGADVNDSEQGSLPGLTATRSGQSDCDGERATGEPRERMPRIDGERRKHRVNGRDEVLPGRLQLDA